MPPFVGESFGDPRPTGLRRLLRRLRRQPVLLLVDWESQRRVATGAAWLDRVAPGWKSRIDWQNLEVATSRRCVCAQVFGPDGYRRMEQRYGEAWAWDHGFIAKADTAAWVALILRSREPATGRWLPVASVR